jgi:hypothetical protein
VTDLRRYSLADVEALAGALESEVELRMLDAEELAERLSELVFRDAGGVYWAFSPLAGAWFRDQGGHWARAPGPPPVLEGPAHLPIAPRQQVLPPRAAATGAGPVPAALPAVTERARRAFESGTMSSDAAEGMLTETYALDRSGRFWTVGVRSGRWYAFADGRWSPADGPPMPASLIGREYEVRECARCGRPASYGKFCLGCGGPLPDLPEATPELDAAAADFLAADDPLPESIAEEWAPPPFPGVVVGMAEGTPRPCPRCGALPPAGARFCVTCGLGLTAG